VKSEKQLSRVCSKLKKNRYFVLIDRSATTFLNLFWKKLQAILINIVKYEMLQASDLVLKTDVGFMTGLKTIFLSLGLDLGRS